MGMEGETWSCPHCGESILRSAVSCPACQRRLRVDVVTPLQSSPNAICPFSIENVIRHPGTEGPWEYSVIVQVYDARGALLTKRVVGVGAVQAGESRRFTVRVEMHVPDQSSQVAVSARRPATDSRKQDARPDQ